VLFNVMFVGKIIGIFCQINMIKEHCLSYRLPKHGDIVIVATT